VLQKLTDGNDRGSERQQSGLRVTNYAIPGLLGRTTVVGPPLEPVEWEKHAAEGSGLGDRVRCIAGRVGGRLQPPTDWRPMVTGGTEPAHKLPGVAGSNTGIKDIHKGSDRLVNTPENGQYHGGGVCQQSRWHSLQRASETDQGAVDMVPTEEYHHQGTAPPRTSEQGG